MPLSERERRLLGQIERACNVEDPKLSSTVRGDGRYGSSRPRFAQGVAASALGLVLLVLGVGITSFSSTGVFLWLSVIGFPCHVRRCGARSRIGWCGPQGRPMLTGPITCTGSGAMARAIHQSSCSRSEPAT
jgi:hypothetical protein